VRGTALAARQPFLHGALLVAKVAGHSHVIVDGTLIYTDLLARIAGWTSDGAHALTDLGYEGEPETFTIPFKKPKNGELTRDQQSCNAIHPRRLGTIVAASLVLLHDEHGRTT
jgi:hypothetical protein